MRQWMLLSLIVVLMGTGLMSCASVGGAYVSSRDTVKGWFGAEDEKSAGTTQAPSATTGEETLVSGEADIEAEAPDTEMAVAMAPENALPAPAMQVTPLAANETGESETPAGMELPVPAAPEPEAAPAPDETMPVPVVTTSPPRAVVKPVGAGNSRWSDSTIWW